MILGAVLLILLWGVVVARFPTLWRDQRQRALWAAAFALAVSRTVAYPPVADALQAPAVQHLTAVLAASFLLRFIMLVTGGHGGRWHRASTAAAALLLAVATVAAAIRPALLTGELTPAAVAYWTAVDLYLGAVLATATVLFWTIAADAPTIVPRAGLRAFAAGTGLLAVDAVFRGAVMVVLGFAPTLDLTTIDPIAEAVQAASVLLTVLGGVAVSTPRARASLRAYRSLVALRPLWTAMREAFPQVILFSPRRALIELAGVDDVHLRLYRRVIEIRDGMLALREHLPEQYARPADPAAAEAWGIMLALHARSSVSGLAGSGLAGSGLAGSGTTGSGTPGVGPAGAGIAGSGVAGSSPGSGTPSWAPVGPDMADEVAWLSRVSKAYRRMRNAADPHTAAIAPTATVSAAGASRPTDTSSASLSAAPAATTCGGTPVSPGGAPTPKPSGSAP